MIWKCKEFRPKSVVLNQYWWCCRKELQKKRMARLPNMAANNKRSSKSSRLEHSQNSFSKEEAGQGTQETRRKELLYRSDGCWRSLPRTNCSNGLEISLHLRFGTRILENRRMASNMYRIWTPDYRNRFQLIDHFKRERAHLLNLESQSFKNNDH